MPDPQATPEAAPDPRGKSAAPNWLGKRVGRFKLLGLLGRGAYGRVFLAEDTDLHRRVALKVVTPDAAAKAVRKGAADEEETDARDLGTDTAERLGRQTVESLVREARAAARLEHPGIVTVFEVGSLPAPGGGMGGFIAMELAEGGTLQELIDAAGPLDARRACTLVADAAEALQSAHNVGVVHRDLKPANLMLTRTGRVKVADFGLAAIDDPSDGHRYTRLVGTPAYVAPEVVLGNASDALSDQYGLAATLFALLAGRPPYVGERKVVLDAHVNKPPPSLAAVRPDVDDRLAAVLQRAMAKDPGGRFDSIGRFGKALRVFTVANDDAAAARPEVPATPSNRTAIAAALDTLDSGRIPTGSGLSAEGLASMLDSAALAGLQRKKRRRQVATLAGICVALAVVGGLVSLAFVTGRGHARAGTEASAAPARAASEQPAQPQPLPPAPVVADDAPAPAEGETGDGEATPFEDAGFPSEERLAAFEDPGFGGAAERAQAAPTDTPGTVSPADYDGLVAIANGEDDRFPDGNATVEGVVSFARTSSTGKVFRLYFEGSQRGRSFAVVWFPQAFPAMQEAFGGTNGDALYRQRIRVTGEVILAPGAGYPEIIVTDPAQVEVIERRDADDPSS